MPPINRLEWYWRDNPPQKRRTGEALVSRTRANAPSVRAFEPNYFGGILAAVIGIGAIFFVNQKEHLYNIDPIVANADSDHNDFLSDAEADWLMKLCDRDRNNELDYYEKKKLKEIEKKLGGVYLNQIMSKWELKRAISRVEEFHKMKALWGDQKQ